MNIALISNRKSPGKIGSLLLDATLRDTHNYSNSVTDYPIENGGNISVHIKKEPISVDIVGFITNSPINFISDLSEVTINEAIDSQLNSIEETTVDRISGAFTELMHIVGEDYPEQPTSATININTPKVIEIITGLRVYSNMVMTKLSIDRSPNDGESLRFTMSFKRIKMISGMSTILPNINAKSIGDGVGNAPNIEDQAANNQNVGAQNPKRLKSVAKRLVDSEITQGLIEKVQELIP